MRREHPGMWATCPPRVKEAVYARVQQQLPGIVRQITDEIGVHIDQLLDPKIMVIDHFQRTRRWSTGSSATSARRSST